ncbi:PKD domain-containing protein, partial [Vibrio sp. FNV 38]|nr:PKD domain-containing protein [Vibrio sp. FNV 38]
LAFVDYENGDYSPALGGALIDAGVSDPRGAAASATDLAGNPRTSGTIDIGCYEYQKLDMTVRIEGATYSQAFAPSTVTFAHVVENSADPSHVSFVYDFGDGSETASTTESTISHAYANPGVYTVTIT